MVSEIRSPVTGMPDTRASIGRWYKQVGDPVLFEEPVVEIDADSVTREILAPATGVLSRIVIADGGGVMPGALLGTISVY